MITYKNIISLVQAVYWCSASSAFLGSGLALSELNVMRGWVTWLLACLIGGVFGIAMSECFVRIRGIKELYDKAPVNGATGARVSFSELLVPYFIYSALLLILAPIFSKRRHQHGLTPIQFPRDIVYLPLVIAAIMAIALIWSRITSIRESRKSPS